MANAEPDIEITDGQEETYEQVVGLTDLGEEMLDEIESSLCKNTEQIALMAIPVIEGIEESVENMTKTFVDHIKASEANNEQRTMTINMAMDNMYQRLESMRDKGAQLVEKLKLEGKYEYDSSQ